MNDSKRLERTARQLADLEAALMAAAKDADHADHFGAMQEALLHRSAAKKVRRILRYAQGGKASR